MSKTAEKPSEIKTSKPSSDSQHQEQQPNSLPYVTLWQDKSGVIQIKLGNDINPVNAVALLELGLFRYKAALLPSISPRPMQAPKDSEPLP